MGKQNAKVDRYIEKAREFARPILTHFREIVHRACPDVEETWKWSFPHFEYKGVLCSMAAFKEHCAFGFWKGQLFIKEADRSAMGHLGRVKQLSDLPPDKILMGYIKQAVRLNEEGIKRPLPPKTAKNELVVPDYFMAALKKNRKALSTFENFTYSHKKEYVEWITEAKREETRASRIAASLQWLAAGKSRHWKYQ